MNGNPEGNYTESGSTGAYAGTPVDSATASSSAYAAAGPDAGSYTSAGPNYTGPNYIGSNYTGPADGSAAGYPPPPPGYVPPPGYAPPYGYAAPPPPLPGAPNPGLALLLGFIPGVGAMYNGQFAKGIAHIVIFAILTSLADHVNGIFGLLVAGWIFYMVFDAYQTARARRDGLVVPDPFGLNNIGERFGMPTSPNWADFMARPAPGSSAADSARTSNPYAGPATDPTTGAPAAGYSYVDPSTGTTSAGSSYYAANAAGAPYNPTVPPASYPVGTVPPPWHPDYPEAVRRQAVGDMGGTPSAGYQPAYAPFDPGAMPPYPPQPSSGIPTGAIWLIGLGVLALAGSLAHNFYWRGYLFGAAACFILGAILLVQQTSVTRKLYPSGTAAYRWSLLHQARFGLLLLLVGVLQTLAGVHVASWHYLWPYLLILFGLLQVADRALYNRMLLEPSVFPNGYPSAGPVPAGPGTPNGAAATVATAEGEVR